jgi:hypothetical protein
MLEIPAGLTLSLILLTLTTFMGFLFAVALSKNPAINKYATWVSVPVLLWIIFQSTLSLNRWYMDRNSAPLLFPFIFTITCMLIIALVPRLRQWMLGLRLEVLIGLQLLRLPVELVLQWAARFRQSSFDLTAYGGSPEWLIALSVPVVFWLKRKPTPTRNTIVICWNLFGIASLLTLWIKGLLGAPSALQSRAFDIPNYLFVHFPGSWIVTVIIPILLFAQLAAVTQLYRVKKENG